MRCKTLSVLEQVRACCYAAAGIMKLFLIIKNMLCLCFVVQMIEMVIMNES